MEGGTDVNSNLTDLEDNKRNHKVEITDIAISKVPLVRYKEIPEEHYETLRELAILVLELSREHNDGNETAITYSLDDPDGSLDDSGSVAVSYGTLHDVEPLNNTTAYHLMHTAGGCVIIILHNHPSLSKISLGDISYLLGYAALKMIVAVTNLGSINYIVKKDSYDRIKALKLYRDAVDMYDKAKTLKERQKATDTFLSNCHKAGLIFEDH